MGKRNKRGGRKTLHDFQAVAPVVTTDTAYGANELGLPEIVGAIPTELIEDPTVELPEIDITWDEKGVA